MHTNLRRPGNASKLTKSHVTVGGKNLVSENCSLLTLCLGLPQCLVASCTHFYYTVKNEASKRSLGRMVAKTRSFAVLGEWLPCITTGSSRSTVAATIAVTAAVCMC